MALSGCLLSSQKAELMGGGTAGAGSHSVDGNQRFPARFNQLRLEVYPVIYRV